MASKKELLTIKQAKEEFARAQKLKDEQGMAAARLKADTARGFQTETKVDAQGNYYQSILKANPPSLKPAPQLAPLKPETFRNAPAITKISKEQQAKNQQVALQELRGPQGNIASFVRGAAGGLIDPFGLRKLNKDWQNEEQDRASAQNTFNTQFIKNPRQVAQGLKPIETVKGKGTYEGLGEFAGSMVGVDPIGIGITKGVQKGIQIAQKQANKIPVLVNGVTEYVDAPTPEVPRKYPGSVSAPLPHTVGSVANNAPVEPVIKSQTDIPAQASSKLVQPISPQKGTEIPKERMFAKNGDLPKVEKATQPSQFKDLGADTNQFNEKRKVSKVYSNTYQNSEMFTQAEKDAMNPREYEYDPVSEKQSIAQAKQRLEADFDGEVNDLSTKARFDGVDTDTAMGILEQYKQEARETGDLTKFNAWSKMIQERGTEGGQMIQAFDKYSRTPEGAVIKAHQTIAKVERDIKKKNPNLIDKVDKETKQVTDAIKKAEDETVKELGEAVEKKVKSIQPSIRKSSAKIPMAGNPIRTVEEAVASLTDKNLGELIGEYTEASAKKLSNQADILQPKKTKQIAPLQQAFDDLTKELYKIAQETLPKVKTAKQEVKATDILKSAIENKQNYQEVWARAKFEIQKKYANNPEAMELLNDFFEKDAIPDFSNKTVNSALDQAVKDMGVNIKDLILNNPKDKTTTLTNIKQYIIENTGATGAEAEALTKQIEAKYVEIVNGKNWTMLENLIKERVKTAPPNEFAKIRQLMNMGAYYSGRYGKATDTATAKAINKTAKDFSQDLNKIVRQNKGDKQKLLTDIQNYVLYNADVVGRDAEILAREIADEYDKILKSKTESALKQMFPEAYGKTITKQGKKSDFEKVMDLINMGAYDNEAIKNVIRAKNNLPVLDNSDIKAILDNMELSAKETDPYLKNMYATRAEQIISDKVPADLRTKFRALQRLSLILNPKTLLTKNPGGNTLLAGAENVKDLIAAPIDIATTSLRNKYNRSKGLPEVSRTTAFAPITKLKAQGEGFVKGLDEWRKDIKYGVDTSPSRGQYELPNGRVFKGNILNALDMFERRGLQLGDRPFYQAAYESRIAELKKLGKTGEEAAIDAKLYALDRVFQNNSELSKRAMQIRKEMGVFGDILMPFVQTPANVMDKLLDYSPVGMAKAVSQLGDMGKGTFNQKLFVDRLGRSLTGVGIGMLAYAMAKNGILTGKMTKNEDLRNAQYLAGQQGYSIKLNGKYYSYDWAQPIGGILAAVTDAYNAGAEKDDILESMAVGTGALIDSVFNMSFLSGVLDAFSGYSPAAGIGGALLSSTSQTTPTAGANLAKVIDPVMRETYNPNRFIEQGNKLVARIPVASKLLPAKVGIDGKPILQSQGRGAGSRALENFLAPYKMSQEKNDPVNNELMRLQSETGDNAVLLNKTPKSFEKGEKFIFTTDEYIQYQKTVGQEAYKNIEKLMASSDYKAMDDDEKAKAIKGIHSDAIEKARYDYLVKAGKSPTILLSRSQQEKFAELKPSGISDKTFYKIIRTADTDNSGQTSKRELNIAMKEAGLTNEQRRAWIVANNKKKK